MKYYFIELDVDDNADAPPYPRERFDTRYEAEETACFRSANHGLAFRVMKLDCETVTFINSFRPVTK